jgi:hypothetical protein
VVGNRLDQNRCRRGIPVRHRVAFGLYGKDVGYGSFDNFIRYTAEVIESPLDYSVFSVSAGTLLLALYQTRGRGAKS